MEEILNSLTAIFLPLIVHEWVSLLSTSNKTISLSILLMLLNGISNQIELALANMYFWFCQYSRIFIQWLFMQYHVRIKERIRQKNELLHISCVCWFMLTRRQSSKWLMNSFHNRNDDVSIMSWLYTENGNHQFENIQKVTMVFETYWEKRRIVSAAWLLYK